MNTITRGDFIRKGSVFAVSVALLGCRHPVVSGHTPECQTTDDILGPFYRVDAPIRTDMRVAGDLGAALIVEGTVYSDDCVTPLSGALVEVWQADGTGAYDTASSDFRYRASLVSGEDGAYAFNTNLPGKYLNGSQFRPSHIHFQVTAEGYRTLFSQVYFEGDSDIAADPWASSAAAEARILTVTELDSGELLVNFDIYLVLA